jgi:hypothetical protein
MLRQLVVVGAILTALVGITSSSGSVLVSKGTECGHPRDLQDAKRLAKQAWSKPYGPSKADRRNWKTIKQCARTNYQRQVRFPNLWEKYKLLFEENRRVLRLKVSCENSPTKAVVNCIEYASVVHSYPEGTLMMIARCESELNPGAYNEGSKASGLFQFLPSTWSATVSRMISAGVKIKNKIWSAKWNAQAAAWKMGQDGTGEWSCA